MQLSLQGCHLSRSLLSWSQLLQHWLTGAWRLVHLSGALQGWQRPCWGATPKGVGLGACSLKHMCGRAIWHAGHVGCQVDAGVSSSAMGSCRQAHYVRGLTPSSGSAAALCHSMSADLCKPNGVRLARTLARLQAKAANWQLGSMRYLGGWTAQGGGVLPRGAMMCHCRETLSCWQGPQFAGLHQTR
jgi:hypothetical protein